MRPQGQLDRFGLLQEARPYVFSEVRGDWCDKQRRDANPVSYELSVHADISSDFTIPVTGSLQFVETELQSSFVVSAAIYLSELAFDMKQTD